MPWLLASPRHQYPWYWLCRICKSLSYITTCVMSIWKNDIHCKYMFMFLLKNLARKVLILGKYPVHAYTGSPLVIIMACCQLNQPYINGLDINGSVQDRHNSSVLAMELCFSCINPSICPHHLMRALIASMVLGKLQHQQCLKFLWKPTKL